MLWLRKKEVHRKLTLTCREIAKKKLIMSVKIKVLHNRVQVICSSRISSTGLRTQQLRKKSTQGRYTTSLPAKPAISPSVDSSKRAKRLGTKQGTSHISSYIRSGPPQHSAIGTSTQKATGKSLYTHYIQDRQVRNHIIKAALSRHSFPVCNSSSSTTITKDCLRYVHGKFGLPVLK